MLLKIVLFCTKQSDQLAWYPSLKHAQLNKKRQADYMKTSELRLMKIWDLHWF